MFNRQDARKNAYMLEKGLAKHGYDWWWHNFTGIHEKTGKEKTFFVEYFLINPALATEKPSFQPPSYLMIKAGAWGEDACQLHNFYPYPQVEIAKTPPFYLAVHDEEGHQVAAACEQVISGSVDVGAKEALAHPEWMSDGGQMTWHLQLDKQVAFNVGYGTSTPFRKMQAYQMYWHAAGMKTAYDGYVIYNGERYRVTPETCYGYADKNWGKDFTNPWIWLSSSDLRSRLTGKKLTHSVFDVGGGTPQVGPVKIKNQLVSAFYYEGQEFEFNFSKFWRPTKTRFSCEEQTEQIVWQVTQENRQARLEIDASCPKKDMLLVKYQSPDGAQRHQQLWNGGTGQARVKLYKRRYGNWVLLDDMDAGHLGCEYGEY